MMPAYDVEVVTAVFKFAGSCFMINKYMWPVLQYVLEVFVCLRFVYC